MTLPCLIIAYTLNTLSNLTLTATAVSSYTDVLVFPFSSSSSSVSSSPSSSPLSPSVTRSGAGDGLGETGVTGGLHEVVWVTWLSDQKGKEEKRKKGLKIDERFAEGQKSVTLDGVVKFGSHSVRERLTDYLDQLYWR